MKCWLFICIIYVSAHYTNEHLVVLERRPKNENTNEIKHVEPPSHATSGEGTKEKSQENEEDLTQDDHSSSDSAKQTSDSEPDQVNPEVEKNELPHDNSGGSQSDDDDRLDEFNKPSEEEPIYVVEMPDRSQENSAEKEHKIRNWNRWVAEVSKGNNAEIMGTNPDTYQPDAYFDLGRRFVPQYPYTERNQTTEYAPPGQEIIPRKAPKEVVDLIARESALRVAAQPKRYDDDNTRNNILRTGDYWNGVWKEDVEPKPALRSVNNQVLGVVRAKIKPGNEFYDLVAKMKKISPRLLYIINEKPDESLNK